MPSELLLRRYSSPSSRKWWFFNINYYVQEDSFIPTNVLQRSASRVAFTCVCIRTWYLVRLQYLYSYHRIDLLGSSFDKFGLDLKRPTTTVEGQELERH